MLEVNGPQGAMATEQITALQPSRHAQYGEHWGEGAARCFSIHEDILDEDHAVRLMPVPDSFVCPISAAIMVDPVATVDGCVYERQYIERWFRERRQQGHRISSPITGLELPSATLMPLVALQRAIEAYLAHRPELKRDHMAGRSFEEAAQILQTDLFAKQAVHATTTDKLKRLKQANKALVRALHEAEARILLLEGEQARVPAPHSEVQPSAGVAPNGGMVVLGGAPPKGGRGAGERTKDDPEGLAGRFTACCHSRCPEMHRGVIVRIVSLVLILGTLSLVMLLRPEPFLAKERGKALQGTALEVLASGTLSPGALSPGALSPGAAKDGRGDSHNPAFVSQLEQLRTGNLDEKRRAAFMLRIFAAEHAENQVAIAEAGAISPLVDLLEDPAPALREEAARALWNLARNNKEINLNNQIAIGRAGAIAPLIKLLEDKVPRVRVVAAAVLNDLATDNVDNQVAVAQAGAIAPLVRLLRNDEAPALVMAASLLKSLAANHVDTQVAVALAGAIPPLVTLLKANTLLAQEQAASTLGALAACSREIQVAIARAGAIVPLVDRLRGDMMQGTAALALRNLAEDNAANCVEIAQAGAILPLVKLLEDGMPGVREEAARALWNIAVDNLDNQVEIVRAGAAIPLVALLKGDAQEQATITLLNLAAAAHE